MKKIVLLLSSIFLWGNELSVYLGNLEIDNKFGNYSGFLFKSNSEDETIGYKIGLKKIYIKKNDFTQTENYFSVKQELELDTHLEFGFQNIVNRMNDGNIYMLNYYINNETDYEIGIDYSDYDLLSIEQITIRMNRFIPDSSFYITPAYYGINVENDRFYNSLEFKIGYMYQKLDVSMLGLIGKTRYLVNNEYYSCNLGYELNGIYQTEVNYQINVNYIVNFKATYYDIKDKLKVVNIALKYRY